MHGRLQVAFAPRRTAGCRSAQLTCACDSSSCTHCCMAYLHVCARTHTAGKTCEPRSRRGMPFARARHAPLSSAAHHQSSGSCSATPAAPERVLLRYSCTADASVRPFGATSVALRPVVPQSTASTDAAMVSVSGCTRYRTTTVDYRVGQWGTVCRGGAVV